MLFFLKVDSWNSSIGNTLIVFSEYQAKHFTHLNGDSGQLRERRDVDVIGLAVHRLHLDVAELRHRLAVHHEVLKPKDYIDHVHVSLNLELYYT